MIRTLADEHSWLLTTLTEGITEGQVSPEVASAALHGAGIGRHLSADALVTILADAATALACMEGFQSGNGEALADDHYDGVPVAMRRTVADSLAAENELARDWCYGHILARPVAV